jgi:hypothetical protein
MCTDNSGAQHSKRTADAAAAERACMHSGTGKSTCMRSVTVPRGAPHLDEIQLEDLGLPWQPADRRGLPGEFASVQAR